MISASALDGRTGAALQWSLDYWRWRAERNHRRSQQITMIEGPRVRATNWKGICGASDEQRLLSRQEAAAVLGVSMRTLRRLKVPHVAIGRRVLYRRLDLQGFIESRMVLPVAARGTPYVKTKSATRGKAEFDFVDWLATAKRKVGKEKP